MCNIMKKILVTGGSGFIGTHLIGHLQNAIPDVVIMNMDICRPHLESQYQLWTQTDILNYSDLESKILNFNPDYVIHLAANANIQFNSLDDYEVNTTGTLNLIRVLEKIENLKHTIITSTQAVCKPNFIPKDDFDFCPNTIYGESKALMEEMCRKIKIKGSMTIIRPTYIWGPYHPTNSKDLFLAIKERYYCYPGKKKITRSYGYVKNVAWQLEQLLKFNFHEVNVFYVGDLPINYYNWVNLFSENITGKKIRIVPLFILKLMSIFGDLISQVTKKPFLINSYRYTNMTEENITPVQRTFDLLGNPPFSLELGIAETVDWLRNTWSKA